PESHLHQSYRSCSRIRRRQRRSLAAGVDTPRLFHTTEAADSRQLARGRSRTRYLDEADAAQVTCLAVNCTRTLLVYAALTLAALGALALSIAIGSVDVGWRELGVALTGQRGLA